MERNIRILRVLYGLTGFLPASAIWILYFVAVTGSATTGPMVFAAGMVIAGILDVPTGMFSDRVGRRAGAIVGFGCLALCVIAYALAQNWWSLLIAAALDGAGMAMLSGNNQALLLESLRSLGREDEFPVQMGKMMGWLHWVAVVAALIGGALATIDLRWAVYASIPSYVAAGVLAWFIREPERVIHAQPLAGHLRSAVSVFVHSRRLSMLAVAIMLSGGLSMAMFMLRPTWSQMLWPIWAIGVARAVAALMAAVGSWWGGAIVNRFGALRAVTATQAASSVANIGALAMNNVVSPVILTSSSFAFGVGMTGDSVMLQREFNDSQRATLASLVSVGTRFVFGIAAVAFGFMAGNGSGDGATIALIAGEILLLVGVGMYLAAFRGRRVQVERRSYGASAIAGSTSLGS